MYNTLINTIISLIAYPIDTIPDNVKQLYKTVLTEGKFSDAGGAGLGLIDIGRKSSEPLEYGFIPFSENYSFFSLNVKINQ